MSSCPLCRHDKNSRAGTSKTALEYTSYRATSARKQLRPSFQKLIVCSMQHSAAFATLITSGIIIHFYDPFHGRAIALVVLGEDGSDLGNETDATLRAYFCKLARFGREGARRSPMVLKIITRIASLANTLHIPRLLEDPSPHLFLAACLIFAVSVALMQHWHKTDSYTNRILVGGFVLGCAAAFRTPQPLTKMKNYLVWSTILALLVSILIHFTIRLWQRHRKLDNDGEMDVRVCDICREQGRGEGDAGWTATDIKEISSNGGRRWKRSTSIPT